MGLLSYIRFTKNTDPQLFVKVLNRVYPDLAYKGGYFNRDVVISKNVLGVIKDVSQKLQEQNKLPLKFINYPKYLDNLSKKKSGHWTVQKFSKALGTSIGRPASKLTIEYTEKTTTHVDKNVTITEKEEILKPDGTIIKRERITFIEERITTETLRYVNIKYENYINETADKFDKELQTSNDPLFRHCHDLISTLMAFRGYESPKQIFRKTILGTLTYEMKDCETELFSYSKACMCLDDIKMLYLPKNWRNILVDCNIDFDNPTLEQFSVLYERHLCCILTSKEKQYIDRMMAHYLISLLEQTRYDLGKLIEFKEKCWDMIGECVLKD